MFLGLLLRQMQATLPTSGGVLSLGVAGDIFESLWAQEIGRVAGQSSPLGLTDLLVRWLESQNANGGQGAGARGNGTAMPDGSGRPVGLKPHVGSAEEVRGGSGTD